MSEHSSHANSVGAYQTSLAIERKAKARLLPFLKEMADTSLVIDVDGGNPLGLLVQKQWGDYLLSKNTKLVSIELKTDTNDTERICFEAWSNLNLANYPSYLQRGHTPGWMVTSRAMSLAYYWPKSDRLALIDLFEFQRWALQPTHGDVPNIERHQLNRYGEVKPQFPYYRPHADQLNQTWIRWVPLPVLQRELTRKPIITAVEQLYLDLGDRPTDRWAS